MSTLLARTNAVWLLAAAVVFVLALPGVSEARWRPVSALDARWQPVSANGVASARDHACDAASSGIGEASDTQLARATLCLLNGERGRRGLPRLRLNERLTEAAEHHSRDMVRRNYFSHDSLSGASFVDRIRRSGYLRSARSWRVGENLAWGSGSRGTPESILRAWMHSPPHRANILTRRFSEIGIGVAEGAPAPVGVPAATYTTNFGSRG